MGNRIIIVFFLGIWVGFFFDDPKDLYYFIAAIALVLSIIGEVIVFKAMKNACPRLKSVFGGEKSLFGEGSIREAGIPRIILYSLTAMWAISYIVLYPLGLP